MESCAVMSDRQIDRHVIEACQQGDREAFEHLFEAYQDRVYSIAFYFYSGDETSARDATQQAFLKLFTKIGQFRFDAEFTTWLYRLVTNVCVDERRKGRRFIPLTEGFAAGWAAQKRSQEEYFTRREIQAAVKAAITELKPKLRLPILLKYIEGLSYEEIANILGCSKGTVASRLNRGHKALAQRLAHLRGAFVPEE